jgi:hemolysin III
LCHHLFIRNAGFLYYLTLYHSSDPGKRRDLLRKADHAAIYWHLPARTRLSLYWYYAIRLLGLGSFHIRVVGLLGRYPAYFRKLKEHSHLETICFVTMGSAILVALKTLSDSLETIHSMAALWWLIGGGVSYIIGALFYSLRKVKYMHFVFHLFILLGSVCHILAIWRIL